MSIEITDNEKKILLKIARERITSQLEKRKPDYPSPTSVMQEKCGAFVTLHKNGTLRGCIGHIVGQKPLIETIKEVSYASAFDDPRFPPVTRTEINHIHIEISVLSPLEHISSTEHIIPGTHGVLIRKGYASGVLLPQVATEQGWDRETFLRHTCLKAGLNGDCWKEPDTEIEVFKAIIFSE